MTYHKTLMLSDVALNINPSVEEKKQIINNLTEFSKALGYDQFKVGILSSVENLPRKSCHPRMLKSSEHI